MASNPIPVVASEKVVIPTKSEIVCLDPGHGGNDIGAEYGKLVESDINLETAKYVQLSLQADGYRVYMTREDDSFVAKRDRSEYCNSVNADIMVSIHHNSYPEDTSVNYATALYYKDKDQLLASSVLNSTATALDIKNQGISKFDNSLLWVADMPAVLNEGYFITNRSEYNSLVKSSSILTKLEADGIYKGIINYFNTPDSIEVSINNDTLEISRKDLGD